MPGKIYKPKVVKKTKKYFTIEAPDFVSPEELKALDDENEYTGPSPEEVEQEIQQKRAEAEEQIRSMHKNAEERAQSIVEQAESGAFQRIKAANDEHRKIIEAAKREAEEIIHQAKVEAEKEAQSATEKRNEIKKEAYKEGHQEGLERAFQEGREELNSIKDRLEKILGETINKRNEIIESSEAQLCNIAIVVARKVVKAITESDQAVILRNISEALRKVKGRATVTIRVNVNDLDLTTRHKDDFYRMLDNIENVNVLEDPNIEKGGCIIETDFGDIDARIATQLDEIETAIKNIQPIKDIG